MAEYKYTTIEEKLGLSDKPNIAALTRQEALDADIEFYINHQWLQCYDSLQNGYFDERYSMLFDAAQEAKAALKESNQAWLALAMFKLGEAVALAQRQGTSKKELHGIGEVNRIRALLKEFAQHWAIEYWKQDTEKKMRVSAMADEVYAMMLPQLVDERYRKHFPEKKAVIEWIKPVAPDYASKKGRPKKQK